LKKLSHVFLMVFIIVIVSGCGNNSAPQKSITPVKPDVVSTLLPGIKDFITQNSSQYGTVKETAPQPDWANGKRQEVATTTGRYLFYTHNNEVVGVWKYESNGKRKQLFQKDIPHTPQNVEVKATSGLPPYTILFQVNIAGGKGKMGEVLIPSYSRSTPKEKREATAKQIARKEGFTDLILYSTYEAQKANNSSSYAQQSPTAMKNGFFGLTQKRNFYSGRSFISINNHINYKTPFNEV